MFEHRGYWGRALWTRLLLGTIDSFWVSICPFHPFAAPTVLLVICWPPNLHQPVSSVQCSTFPASDCDSDNWILHRKLATICNWMNDSSFFLSLHLNRLFCLFIIFAFTHITQINPSSSHRLQSERHPKASPSSKQSSPQTTASFASRSSTIQPKINLVQS